MNELAGILVESENPSADATQVRWAGVRGTGAQHGTVQAGSTMPMNGSGVRAHTPASPALPLWCPLMAPQDRVKRLVDEVCLLCTRTALCNPPGSKHFALTKVRTAAAFDEPTVWSARCSCRLGGQTPSCAGGAGCGQLGV